MFVTLSNDVSELERLHQVLNQFGKEQALPENLMNTMNLALEEIVTNVIKHGYGDNREHFIVIRCCVQDGEIMAEVEDDGQAFNPLQYPDPDISVPLESRHLGGLGIYLVRNVMDTVAYTYEDGKNCITLRKRIPGC